MIIKWKRLCESADIYWLWTRRELNPVLRNANAVFYRYTTGPAYGSAQLKLYQISVFQYSSQTVYRLTGQLVY